MDLKVGFLEILENFPTNCFAQTLEIKSSPNQSTKPNTTTQTKPSESPSFPQFVQKKIPINLQPRLTVSTIPLCVEVNGQIKEILGHFAWRISLFICWKNSKMMKLCHLSREADSLCKKIKFLGVEQQNPIETNLPRTHLDKWMIHIFHPTQKQLWIFVGGERVSFHHNPQRCVFCVFFSMKPLPTSKRQVDQVNTHPIRYTSILEDLPLRCRTRRFS